MKRNHGDMPVWNFIFKEAFFMAYNFKDIEKKWQEKWYREGTYNA